MASDGATYCRVFRADLDAFGRIAGTAAAGTFTTGSVIHAGASGELAEDNVAFFYDAADDRLLVGDRTSEPAYAADTHLVVEDTSSSGATASLAILAGTGQGEARLKFGDSTDEALGGVAYEVSPERLSLQAGGATRIELTPTAMSPATAGAVALGSTVAEYKSLYLGDDNGIYLGADQEARMYYDSALGRLRVEASVGSLALNGADDMRLNVGGTEQIRLTGTTITPLTSLWLGTPTFTFDKLYLGDDDGIYLGASQDARVYYDGTDNELVLDSATTWLQSDLVMVAAANPTLPAINSATRLVLADTSSVDASVFLTLIAGSGSGTGRRGLHLGNYTALGDPDEGGIDYGNGDLRIWSEASYANALHLTSSTFYPGTAGAVTLGTGPNPWGAAFFDDDSPVYLGASQDFRIHWDTALGVPIYDTPNAADQHYFYGGGLNVFYDPAVGGSIRSLVQMRNLASTIGTGVRLQGVARNTVGGNEGIGYLDWVISTAGDGSTLGSYAAFSVASGGAMFEAARITEDGYFGVGTTIPVARCHFKVSSTDAIPVVELQQDDDDEPFIEFDSLASSVATSPQHTGPAGESSSGTDVSAPAAANWLIDRMLRITCNGTELWLPVYAKV